VEDAESVGVESAEDGEEVIVSEVALAGADEDGSKVVEEGASELGLGPGDALVGAFYHPPVHQNCMSKRGKTYRSGLTGRGREAAGCR
jgi:hypothetical protein